MSDRIKTIVLGGGCFWGVEAFFKKIPGVKNTESGYANGQGEASYSAVCGGNGYVECVRVDYDEERISLKEILNYFFGIIDPTKENRQGPDIGVQYRTGIYYSDDESRDIALTCLEEERGKYKEELYTEVLPLESYHKAEEYHQDYLAKNPGGYCHIDMSRLATILYPKPDDEKLKSRLSDIQYFVTQKNGTEPPFRGEYDKHFEEGLYVDVVTGEPLFSSKDKYDAGCGWPSFTKPLKNSALKESYDMAGDSLRVEVRSAGGDSHLGHVFDDGPKDRGGNRYCINSAALRFIPKKDLAKEGYADLEKIFD